MQAVRDTDLLRQYVRENSEAAFATLVARHVNMVYSAAWRKTGNPAAAEEITQAVFIMLARKADALSRHAALSGWLYQATRLTAANYLRTEIRRAQREQEAYMQSRETESESELWPQIMPLLEDAMGQLGEKDRNALALRFFEGRSYQEIGTAFGASENAAKKRVGHALEKLRKYFSKRGVSSTAASLAVVISANSVQAAPAMVTKAVTAAAVAKGAAASGSTLTLVKGALKIMAWSKMKTAVIAGVVVLLMTGTATMLIVHHQRVVKAEEIPRTAWKFAGYADPQSALMSFLFVSVCQSDRTAFETSLSPDQLRVYHLMLKRNTELPQHPTEAQLVAEIFKSAREEWQNGGYRIIKVETVSADQVMIHLHFHNSRLDMNARAKMKKVGNEWKYDGHTD